MNNLSSTSHNTNDNNHYLGTICQTHTHTHIPLVFTSIRYMYVYIQYSLYIFTSSSSSAAAVAAAPLFVFVWKIGELNYTPTFVSYLLSVVLFLPLVGITQLSSRRTWLQSVSEKTQLYYYDHFNNNKYRNRDKRKSQSDVVSTKYVQ